MNKCLSCQACTFACQKYNKTYDLKRRRLVSLGEGAQKMAFSSACHHCQTPACMSVCPNFCFSKRRNGIVTLNSQTCSGCGLCASACPFSAISLNQHNGKADKCDMCYDRQQRGETPSCLAACTVGALTIGNIDHCPDEYVKITFNYEIKTLTHPSTQYIKHRHQPQKKFIQSKEDTPS